MEATRPSRNPARFGSRPSVGTWAAILFTLGCVVLAFRLRSLDAAGVFDGDPLYLSGVDAYGYMRRAWLALAHWPRVALFDTAIGFPRGLPVLSDIGFDFILATIARTMVGAHPSRIAGRARPGSTVTATIDLRTPGGRTFAFACATRAAADGRFGILVPYRSSGLNGDGGTRGLGPWEVRRDGALAHVEVTERDVIDGGETVIP